MFRSFSPLYIGKGSFNKGVIYNFDNAISIKLVDIIKDSLNIRNKDIFPAKKAVYGSKVHFIRGTSLIEMQNLEDNSFQAIITSPSLLQ